MASEEGLRRGQEIGVRAAFSREILSQGEELTFTVALSDRCNFTIGLEHFLTAKAQRSAKERGNEKVRAKH